MDEKRQDRSLHGRIVSWATNPRVATWLIAIIGIVSLVGMAYPQRKVMTDAQLADWRASAPLVSRAGEALGLDRLFTTWYFVTLLMLLVAVTAVCSVRRIWRQRRITSVPSRHPASAPSRSWVVEDADAPSTLAIASRTLSRVPGSVATATVAEEDGSWRFSARAGRLGFWGSMMFHLALIVIALGAVFSALTAFTGKALVTVGQTFVDEPAAFLSVSDEPRVGPAYSGAAFTLDRLQFDYAGDVLTRTRAYVTRQGSERAGETSIGEVNYPIEIGGKSYLLGNSGYSVALRIGAEGTVTESYYALGTRAPGGYEDRIELPGGVTADISAVPRAGVSIEREVPRRYELDDPVVHVRLTATGRTLWEGDLVRDVPVEASGYRLMLADVQLWNEFLVRGDRGRLPVYAGLWLVVVGLVVRFFDVEKRVLVSWDGSLMTVSARHRFGRVSSEVLVRRIATAVGSEDVVTEGEGRA